MTSLGRHTPSLLVVVLLLGCEPVEESPEGGDGGADGGGDGGAGLSISPPEEPALPTLTPCPEGWTEVPPATVGSPATCSPWPEGEPASCAADEAHFPGEPGCSPIGPPCPSGDWAEDVPSGGSVIYVLATAPEGGVGTRDAPYGTIGAALSAASEGDVVAVGKGTYEGAIQLPAGVTLWGACVAETVLQVSSASDMQGVVNVAGRDGTLRSLQITGRRVGLMANGDRSVHLQDVLIFEAEDAGILIDSGAEVTASSLVVRDTRSRASDGFYGRGIDIEAGEVELERASIEGSRTNGIFIAGAESVALLDQVAVTRTRGRLVDLFEGTGIDVAEGARVEARALALHQNRHAGLFVRDPGSEAVVTAVVVSHTAADEQDGQGGHGLRVMEGGRIEAQGLLVHHSQDAGVFVSDGGAEVLLADFVVYDTFSSEADGLFGVGVLVQSTARAELRRGYIQRNRFTGVLASFEGTEVVAEDLTISDTTSEDGRREYTTGSGIVALRGSVVDAARVRIARANSIGVVAGWAGTAMTLQDVHVLDTFDGTGGIFGRGFEVFGGAHVRGERVLVERSSEVGVAVFSPGTEVELVDLVVSEVTERACAEAGCGPAGIGLGTYAGAHMEVRRFVVTRTVLAGVQLASGTGDPSGENAPGNLDLHEGEVFDNPIGANVQHPDYDLARLGDRVVYRDNGRDLDTAAMPSPSAGDYVEE